MATTYQRLRKILDVATQETTWESEQTLAKEVRRRRFRAFRLRGDGKKVEDHMQVASIQRLVRLLNDFGLLRESSDGGVSVSSKGNAASRDDKSFKKRICPDVVSYLKRHGCSLKMLAGVVADIKLPDVPDIETIYERLPTEATGNLSESELRRLLFLYACADGVARKTRVHYQI